ncbi:serine/threonine-protein kinase Nek8-like [Lineus longissimus]|uniref:serine/threonine-protein kinase Nek8-like n=1 Tax=Lineus longissimus TaxID=88925 RepID=UPI002B4E4E4A
MMEKYEKIRVVGRGAYGTVYLCKRLHDNKMVIIKQIPVEQMTKEERQAALNEVKVLSMLDHPNIIEYYENFLEDKALMIVMEYAQGGTLFEFLQQRNGNLFEEEEILKYFVQMLLSLQHVHSKQILHRDLKTQNILLDKKREVIKVGDFGISKVLSSKSKAYTVVGTPCYISPELCEGMPYNQKSDIWALGCVLYELASLKRAFEAANLPALVLKIMRGTFAPIAEHYSSDMRSLILSMLHLDPNKRPHIHQIMAQPIVMNSLMNLYTDMGKIPCTRIHRPMQPAGRGRMQRTSPHMPRGSVASISETEPMGHKHLSPSTVYSWGNGIMTPVKLPLPSVDTHVTQVSAGRTQKAAVTKNGRLFVWEGSSVGGESGLPGAISSSMDQPLQSFIPRYLEGQSGVTIQHVSCGDLFTACLTDRGILMTFGSGANGCLGHGNTHDVTQAKIVEALLGYEVVNVSCGASHVLAVTNEHELFAWGRGESGRLGLGSNQSFPSPQPVPIPDQFQPRSVHCGVDCSVVITVDKKMLCCGSNRSNKLAMDEFQGEGGISKPMEEVYLFTPVEVPPLVDLSIESVAMGTSHTAVITDSGECYTVGSNNFGQLGHKVHEDRLPAKVAPLESEALSTVACGDTFTVGVTTDGKVYTWGKNSRGRLGRLDDETSVPKVVKFPGNEMLNVVSLSCSHGNTLLSTKPPSRGNLVQE